MAFSSCLAYPFTVSTRLGMRSARLCSVTSTCDHSAATASLRLTRSLRMLTNCPPTASRITTSTAITIRAIFMSWFAPLFFQPVHGVDHDIDLLEIRIEQDNWFQVARLDAVFSQIEKVCEWLGVDAELIPRLQQDLPFAVVFRRAVKNQRMAKQHAEGGDGIGQKMPQYVFIPQSARGFLAQPEQLGPEIVLHLRAIEAVFDR